MENARNVREGWSEGGKGIVDGGRGGREGERVGRKRR